MTEHHRTTLSSSGEMLADPSEIPLSGAAARVSNAAKARLIVLLAILAVALSAFAVFRVVSRTGDEPPDAELTARAAAIEMQMSADQPPPAPPEPSSNASPPERRRGPRSVSR